jgi:hypothetical protein
MHPLGRLYRLIHRSPCSLFPRFSRCGLAHPAICDGVISMRCAKSRRVIPIIVLQAGSHAGRTSYRRHGSARNSRKNGKHSARQCKEQSTLAKKTRQPLSQRSPALKIRRLSLFSSVVRPDSETPSARPSLVAPFFFPRASLPALTVSDLMPMIGRRDYITN